MLHGYLSTIIGKSGCVQGQVWKEHALHLGVLNAIYLQSNHKRYFTQVTVSSLLAQSDSVATHMPGS